MPDTIAPVGAVKVDLARDALDRVPPAGLVAHARAKIDSFDDNLFRFGQSASLQQEGTEPVAGVEREARQDAALCLAPDVADPLQRLVEAARALQRPSA